MKFTKKELSELVKEELARKNKIKELETKKVQINEELKSLNAKDFESPSESPITLDEWIMSEENALLETAKVEKS
jgi:CRISPR/Cas system CSM-associated protein Csm4 (group 5 of RAMP superfamily)